MKLASYRDGSRDGQLVVVARDLSSAHYASGIANHLQQVLDDWNFLSPQLQDLYDALNQGKARHAFAFDPRQCLAPLPRACQWAEGSAYASHGDLLAAGAGVPSGTRSPATLRMAQRASDDLLGPCDDIVCPSQAFGIDFGAGLAVITADVPMGATPARALEGVRLLMLANGVRLRSLVPDERASGCALVQSKPAGAFSPVAVTLDELGGAWDRGRLDLTLQSSWNGRRVGMCEAGPEMTWHFGELIAHLCRTRNVRAGSIVGSGTVSNQGVDVNGRPDWPKGHGCIAEKRAIETIRDGQPATGFMQFGDTIRIEMKGRDGHSIFGAIEQQVAALLQQETA